MERIQFLAKAGALLSASLMFVTLNAFSQQISNPNETTGSGIAYKQLHGSTLGGPQGLFSDGLKLKLDLSVLDESALDRIASERLEFDPDAIPADDVYGGVWGNSTVAYGSLQNAPDTFIVDMGNFTMPVDGHMTSNFGRRGSRRYHYGVDLKAQTGDTVYAAFDGKVRVKRYERRGYGYFLVLRHINGLETVYGHLSKFLVEENDFVRSGQAIGLAGNTGRSYGSHLHFETRFLGKAINPNFIIDFQKKTPHNEEYLLTNSSYRKTTASSRSLVTTGAANKYVSGEISYHRIQEGDTLSIIARRYGTSVSELCALNKITPQTTLRIGRTLRVS
jgi:murein DD-endopeptidase MepM/ murein hydrolase activator NlpD